jgi:signal transduction histidine kinase/HAMP domain-containing protein
LGLGDVDMAEKNNGATKRQSVKGKLRTIGNTALRYNIGVRFFSFVVVVAVLSGGVVGFVIVRNSRDYLRQQALQNNLNQANLAASYASNYIAAIEAHVKVFATRPDIVQAVSNGTVGQLQPTLAEFVQIQTALSGVGIYDTSGIQLAYSLADSTALGQSFAARNWFQGVIASGQPYLGTPILSASGNIPVETFAVPVLDSQGNIRAILAAGISLAGLSSAIVNIGFNSDTQGVLIDTRNGGSIIADSNPALLLTAPMGDNQAVSQLLAGGSGSIVTTGGNNKQDLTGFSAVPKLPWGIMVLTPSSAAFSILDSLTERASIYAALIVLLSGIFGVFLVLGITRPLNRLMADTKEIGSGNLDVKLETTGKDEIGDLSRAFSEMTVKLKTTMVSRDDLIKEVAERKQAEESLKESEYRYRSLFDNMSNGLAYCQMLYQDGIPVDFKYLSVNRAFEKQTRLKDVTGKLVSEVIPGIRDSDPEVFKLYGRVSSTGLPDQIEMYVTALKMWFSISVYSPQQGYFVAIFDDITERKLLELEREKFTRELTEKNAELERFTYTVSHDLKSPLVTIKTFLGYLSQDMTADDKQRVENDLLFMNGAANKMGLLLQELLEMSRIGRIVNPSIENSSAEIIKEAVGLLAGPIADRGVKVIFSGKLVTLYGDRSRLIEIWQNLVENAIKFMGDQPSPQIEIGVEHKDSDTVFFVRDNGIGIEPQYQSKIFNLFEKLDTKTEGTGMGLAIVKRIVELYQGKIWVESKGTGQGTIFYFTLPGALVDNNKGG